MLGRFFPHTPEEFPLKHTNLSFTHSLSETIHPLNLQLQFLHMFEVDGDDEDGDIS